MEGETNNTSTQTENSSTPLPQPKLISVSSPSPLGESRFKKRFAVKIRYADEHGKNHTKTVRFGIKGVQDYIDHHDQKKLSNLRKRIRKNTHFLQPNFWREKVLNQKDNIEEAFTCVLKELKLL